MKTQTHNNTNTTGLDVIRSTMNASRSNPVRGDINSASGTKTILWFLIRRHRFEIVSAYALSVTTWYIVTNFALAWTNVIGQ